MACYPPRRASARSLLAVIVLFATLSGCRSYGGQGSEEAIYQEIQRGHQTFEAKLDRRRAELRTLQQAASGNERLADLAEQYALMVQGHEALLADQGEEIASLSSDSDYRDLNRFFGAMIAMHRTVQLQYDRLLDHSHRTFLSADTVSSADTVRSADSVSPVKRPYALIPPYFDRVREGQRELTLNDVIAAAGAQSPGEDDSQPAAPDTTAGAAEPLSEGGPVSEGGPASEGGPVLE